jgi:hypothetical protein
VVLLLKLLSLREGGGDGNAPCSFSEDGEVRLKLYGDSGFILGGFDGEDMIVSEAQTREGTFESRGESGEGELRSGEEERGDGWTGV